MKRLFIITAHFSVGPVVFCIDLLASSFIKEMTLSDYSVQKPLGLCLWLVKDTVYFSVITFIGRFIFNIVLNQLIQRPLFDF